MPLTPIKHLSLFCVLWSSGCLYCVPPKEIYQKVAEISCINSANEVSESGIKLLSRLSVCILVTWEKYLTVLFQRSSVAQSCPALCDPTDYSTPGFPVHHQLPELVQTHVHWVGGGIQLSHPLLSPSPPAFSLSQHQGLFKWVSSSHQVAKVLEFQLQHQSFQWIFSTDLL